MLVLRLGVEEGVLMSLVKLKRVRIRDVVLDRKRFPSLLSLLRFSYKGSNGWSGISFFRFFEAKSLSDSFYCLHVRKGLYYPKKKVSKRKEPAEFTIKQGTAIPDGICMSPMSESV